jgi:hypothetical protein
MNALATFLITQLATLLIGSSTFSRVEACVERWNDKVISEQQPDLKGKDKKKAVLAELIVLGILLEEWLVNLVIELAVAKTKELKS